MDPAVAWKRRLWILLFVAFAVRLTCAIGVQAYVSKDPGRLCLIAGDAEGYWELAGKLVAFQDFSIHEPPRWVLRMPGFPALLAVPRFLFGNNPFAARVILAIVGTAACGLTCMLGREFAGDIVGLLAGWYTAFSPTMVLFSVLFLSEIPFAAAMLASLVASAKLVHLDPAIAHAHSWSWIKLSILTGLLIAVATYMRPTWLLLGPGLGVCLILFGRTSLGVRCMQAVGVCVSLAVAMAPWTYRNYVITGHFVPTTLWVGPSLYDGLNPTANGDSDMTFFDQDNLLQTMSEYEMNREYTRRAWAFAAANPGRAMSLALAKQARYWCPAPNGPQFRHPVIQIVAWLAFLPLVSFAIVGAWLARRDAWFLILTTAPLFYFAALHLLFVGSLRYRLPAEFPLAVLAAYGLSRLVRPPASTMA